MIRFNSNDDAKLAVKFYKKASLNKFKSEKEGRQIFEDVERIKIKIPGDNTSVVDRVVTAEDKVRFASRYENFIKNNEEKLEGTAIMLLPGISDSDVHNCKAMQVETVEQLSGLQERYINQLNNGRILVKKANKFLEGEKYSGKLEHEIDKLKADNKKLQMQLEALLKGGQKDEPTNNSTKRSKRNATRSAANDSNRE